MKKRMKNILKSMAVRLPLVGPIVRERDALRTVNEKLTTDLARWRRGFVAPGHYYSPVVDIEYIRNVAGQLFAGLDKPILGIDLNENAQLGMLAQLEPYYAELPFVEQATPGFRYYLDNDFYAFSDGICLYLLIRHIKPRRFVEVGSGFSSAAALDVNDKFFDGQINFTFIEPYPDRLQRLLTPSDRVRANVRILEKVVQDVSIDTFESLESGDILFIDSSHVAKTGSDLNHLLFNVLPVLKPGVYVHFHDIFFPFEYPREWIYDGRSWNELYLLRSFLQYNKEFEIVYFNTFLENRYGDRISKTMPLCTKRPTKPLTIPGSIWIRRRTLHSNVAER